MTSPTASLDQIRSALTTSAGRLASLVEPLGPDGVRRPSYCDGWAVADVLSHLGSGAVMFRERLDGEAAVDAQPIWDSWNAKSPDEQASDALAADVALLARVDSFDPAVEAAADRRYTMGPLELDLTTFLGLRLSEHVVHTWDIEVTSDPAATLPESAVALLIDSLVVMAGLVGRPNGAEKTITVRTSGPARDVSITLAADQVSLVAAPAGQGPVDLELPAEALFRLVYGRLDPDHTPPVGGSAGPTALEELRQVFPGF